MTTERFAMVAERWKRPLEQWRAPAFRIIGNIYYVGNRDVSCHLLTSGGGHVLIDTGFAKTVPLLLESIRALGLWPEDIRLVLHTHGHVDHTGGTARIVEISGAETALHRGDVETVEQATPMTGAYYVYGTHEFDSFGVDRPLDGGEVFEVGDTLVRVHHTPGHTPGAVTFEIEVRYRDRTVTAALFGGPGQWTFEPENRSQGYPGDMADYRRTLTFLRSMKVDVPLGGHPEHAQVFTKWAASWKASAPELPFLDPQGWQAEIRKREESFRELQASQ